MCVPVGNNPEKNEAMRGFGATLIEEGRDYDESVEIAQRVEREKGLYMVKATDDPLVIAGAATLSLEVLRARPQIGAIVVAIGGGSQAVGALTAARELRRRPPSTASRRSARPRSTTHGTRVARSPAIPPTRSRTASRPGSRTR